MEPDKELYQRTFSRLQSSPELRKELLSMTEQARKPKKFVLRRLIVAAAVLALIFALAMGANAASGGELYEMTVGKMVATLKTNEGTSAILYEKQGEDGQSSYIIEEEAPSFPEESSFVCGRSYELVEGESSAESSELEEAPAPEE